MVEKSAMPSVAMAKGMAMDADGGADMGGA
jgi:hypothetical protein